MTSYAKETQVTNKEDSKEFNSSFNHLRVREELPICIMRELRTNTYYDIDVDADFYLSQESMPKEEQLMPSQTSTKETSFLDE